MPRSCGRYGVWTGLAWALLLLFLGGTASVVRADDAPATATRPWRDTAMLERRFAEALEAVEAIRGVSFEKRPTLRISDRNEVAAILRRELEPQLAALGLEEQLDAGAAFAARLLLAKYEPGAHVVHLVPARFEDEDLPLLPSGEVDEDFLRVVLVHEATHAHDFPRYGWSERISAVESQDALRAFDAVVEGHAQFVSRRAAERWGIPRAFDAFTEAILHVPEIENETLRTLAAVMVAEFSFGYVKGHAFLEAVAEARGREGVEQVLGDPPASTRAIEHPHEYLDPARVVARPDLAEAVEAFAPLVADEGWMRVKSRLFRGTLDAIAPTVPEPHRKSFLRGYEEGHALVGQIPADQRQCVVMLLLFETSEDARAFLAAERATQEAKDAAGGIEGLATIEEVKYGEGGGRGSALPGFTSLKTLRVGGQEMVLETHSFLLGRLFGQVLRMGVPEIQRRHEDAAIQRLQHYLEDPAGSREAGVFDAPAIPLVSQHREFSLEVVGPDGEAVSHARVAVAMGDDKEWGVVRNGKALLRLPLDFEPDGLFVYGARDAHGKPMALAPTYLALPAEGKGPLVVWMAEGARVSGRVLGPEGTPVPDVDLTVGYERPGDVDVSTWYDWPYARVDLLSVRTDEEGRFEFVGLGAERIDGRSGEDGIQAYEIEVEPPADWAHVDRDVSFRVGEGPLAIEVLPATAMTITVRDPEGDAVEGARVRMEPVGDLEDVLLRLGGPDPRERTDAEGRVRLEHVRLDRRYDLEVEPPKGREDLARAWRWNQEPADVDLALEPGFTVRGVVLDASGRPVARVRVVPRERRVEIDGTEHVERHEVKTDEEGLFVLRHLPMSVTELGVTHRNLARAVGGRVRLRGEPGSDEDPETGFWVPVGPVRRWVEIRVQRP